MVKPKIFFYVQHLLGIGHIKRATTLARAMSTTGFDVTLVSGGRHVPVINEKGMKFIQLPALRSLDRTFKGLIDDEGKEISDQIREKRRNKLMDILDNILPDILIVEMFPFGRKMLEFEIIPLLDKARDLPKRPFIVSSVRVILVDKRDPKREAEMVKKARRYFDCILVHGDEKFISFDATFPLAKEIKDMIYYTGYVVEPLGATDLVGRQGRGEVIVSSGSGAVGELILRTAIRIRRHTYLSKAKWRLLAGHFMDDNVFNDIVSYASDGIVVERARPDFLTLLKNSRLSISQGGYNTIMEALLSGTKCIAIPYAGGKETEQTLRAKALEQLGLIKQIPEGILTDEVLIRLVNETKNAARSKSSAIDLGGAPRSAEIMAQLIRATNSRY